ncbi:MAG: O-antigen ligase [Planctomycetota bacterium]|nr:O-antigen ligase [Planctomycetota bacterium]
MVIASRSLKQNQKTAEDRFLSQFALMTFFVIVLCYFNIDHNWNASEIANTNAMDYTSGDENITADRISAVNPLSTISRLVFAFWGCVCFLFGPKNKIRSSTPLFWSLVVLAMFSCASVMWSAKPSQTIFKLAVLGTLAIGGAGIAMAFRLREILTIICFSCIAFILIGVASELRHGYFRPGANYRFMGTTHPNTEAIFASLLCIVSRMFLSKFGWGKLIGMAVFAFGMLVVWYTRSRTTLAGLLLSLLITQTLIIRGSSRTLLVAGLLAFASLGLAASTMITQSSAKAFGKVATMGREDDVSSLSGRLPLWEELLSSVEKKPILGYGYLAFWDAKKVEYLSATFRWEIPHAHNLYLDVLLDGGIVGLTLVLLTILCAFVEASKLYARHGRIEFAILFGIFAYAVINGLAESIFKLPNFSLFVIVTLCFSMLTEPMKVSQS